MSGAGLTRPQSCNSLPASEMKVRVTGTRAFEEPGWNGGPRLIVNLACGHTTKVSRQVFNSTRKNKKWPCDLCAELRRNRR